MSPSATQRHRRIQLSLLRAIDEVLPPGVTVLHDWGWKPGTDEFVPDLMVF